MIVSDRSARPMPGLSAGLLVAILGCSGVSGDDSGRDRDEAGSDDFGAVDESRDAWDEGAQDNGDSVEVGDCPLCGTPCEGADPACGENCCVAWMVYRPDGTHYTPYSLSCESFCTIHVYFYGMLLIDYAARPELRTHPDLPRLTDYEYRGDGTELLVGGVFVDLWYDAGCLDHCYPTSGYLWVLDVRDWTVIAFEAEHYPGRLYDREAFDILTNYEYCPSPIPGDDDSEPPCAYRVDVPALDETFYMGFRRTHVLWAYSSSPERFIERMNALPVVLDALPVYRLSTGDFLGYANLRLEDPVTR